MANTNIINNNVTVNPETSNKVVGAADAMRDAIIEAAQTGNKHAITNLEAAYAGAEPEDFSRWNTYCEALRQVAIEYGKLVEKKDSTKKQLALASGRVREKWQQILTVGEVDKFHPNMFTREQDADTMRVYAYNNCTLTIPGLGSVAAVTPSKIFRNCVERFLGLRIRANEALCDADRDCVSRFLGNQKTVQTCVERLNGKNTDDGHEPGLIESLAGNEKKLADSIELLASVGVSEEDAMKNPALLALDGSIKALTAQIEQARKTLSDAQKYIAEHREQYERVIATINQIERPQA